MANKPTNKTESLCKKCNSYSYCLNKSNGVISCINFNKFPKPSVDEGKK